MPRSVESVLRKIEDPRDRALFWLIYDGGLRSQEALAIDIDDISWPDRSIRLHVKGDRPREMFFAVWTPTATRASRTGRPIRSGKGILPTGISTNGATPPSACVLLMTTPKSTSIA
jgi:integrase